MVYLVVAGNIITLYEKKISVYPSKWLKLNSLKPSKEILGRKENHIWVCPSDKLRI